MHTDWVLSHFGKRINTCRKRYEEFVRAGRGDGYREEFHEGADDQRILGDVRFVEKMLDTKVIQSCKRKQINFKDLVRHVCKEYQLKEKD
jgi:hypothetical protein